MNFSSDYFSFKQAEPSLLPRRLRVGPGSTRYVDDISIEELNELGYEGPVENKPDIPADALYDYCWDFDALKYVQVFFDSKEDKYKNEWVYDSESKTTIKQLKDSISLKNNEVKLLEEIRIKRNTLLNDTDWTQLADVNYFIRQAFKKYRQFLRELPNNTEIWDIEFPPIPSTDASIYTPSSFTQGIDDTKTGYFVYDPLTGELVLDHIVSDLSTLNDPL
jgi:hypothetical protein